MCRIGTRYLFTSFGFLIDVLLARRLVLRNLHRLERLAQRLGELAHALGVALPAEHLVDDVHVAEQIGDDAVVGLALDVVEHHRAAAVHVLLQAGDLEVGIDLLVGLDQVALRLQPGERGAQIAARDSRRRLRALRSALGCRVFAGLLRLGGELLFLADVPLHR